MSNFVVSIAPGSATTNNGQITYTYILTMDAAASVDEPISYELKGVGANAASIDELSRNQALTGTVIFKPGETQKILTVTLPTKPVNEPDKTFEVTLTSSLAWVTPDPNKNSVIALVSSTPKSGYGQVIDGEIYYPKSTTLTYTPTTSNDYVQISGGSTIKTLAGDDKVIATSGNNIIDTGDGNDLIKLGSGRDTVIAGAGNDHIVVTQINSNQNSSQKVSIDGGNGVDILDFSNLMSQQTTSNSAKGVYVDLGRQIFYPLGSSPSDAGSIKGVEQVIGSALNDLLMGGKNVDVFNGGAGDDIIYSQAGNDELIGNDGNDELDGGLGGDILTGGAGKDIFGFGSTKDLSKETRKTDTITDFTHGEDKIRLTFDLNSKEPDKQQKVDLIGNTLFTKIAGQIRYSSVITEGSERYILLQGDINGDGSADWTIKLLGISSISYDDFLSENL